MFGSNTEITSFNELELFTGLKSIDNSAFKASSLKSIKLPSSVTTINYQAFHSCKELEYVPDLSNVQYFNGDGNFAYCSNMKGVADLRGSSNPSSALFGYCTSLEGILLREDLVSFNPVIRGCTSIKWVDFPTSLKYFSGGCDGCTSLKTNLNFPNVIRMLYEVFRHCPLDSELYAPKLEELGYYTFAYSGVKGDLNLPSLKIMLYRCFENTAIETVSSLGSLETLDYSVFANCKQLASVVLPNTLKTINHDAFRNCSLLTNVVLPESITTIGEYAFHSSPIENDINLPNLEKMGTRVFNKTKIKKVISLGQITELLATFESCDSLEECILPETLISIGNVSFANCVKLKQIDIPKNVTSIGNSSFQTVRDLNYVICRPTTPPTLGSNNFTSIPGTCVFYVPDESISDYQAATNWNAFASKMKGISEL